MSFSFRLLNDKEQWNSFVERSPQGSIFSSSGFLECYGHSIDYCVVEEDGKPLAAVAVLQEAGKGVLPAPLYFGLYPQTLLFDESIWNQPSHVGVPALLKITDFFLGELWARYGRIAFTLHPSLQDIRALSWFHYQQPALGTFKTNVNYTGIIDLSSYQDFEAYLRSIRRTRRQEYAAAARKGLSIRETMDLDLLLELYRQTHDRQGIEVASHHEQLLKNIFRFCEKSSAGRMLVCTTSEGRDVAATLFLRDSRTAYYFIGANHPDSRQLNAGPYLVLENIKFFWNAGLSKIDMVGINSPNRGDFKISFDAKPVPFFVSNCKAST